MACVWACGFVCFSVCLIVLGILSDVCSLQVQYNSPLSRLHKGTCPFVDPPPRTYTAQSTLLKRAKDVPASNTILVPSFGLVPSGSCTIDLGVYTSPRLCLSYKKQ